MINFEKLEARASELSEKYSDASPFSYVIIDDFCDEKSLLQLLECVPDPADGGIGKSRDYIFAKNKYEKSQFETLGKPFADIHEDLLSERFKTLLQTITGNETFVDPAFHGGGIHQGGEGSFLDMHVDFNYHPEKPNWFRDVNILLYLNKDWKPSYGGSLKLRHRTSGVATEVEPLFNRCVIMQTRDFTLHGYDAINFPVGSYRRSIATYGYHVTDTPNAGKVRSTVWYPENNNIIKSKIGELWPALVALKGKILGSSTSRNR